MKTSKTVNSNQLDLYCVNPVLHDLAIKAFEESDALGFVSYVDNTEMLMHVWRNIKPLIVKGMYEECLVDACSATRTNNITSSMDELRQLFAAADPEKLLAAGNLLPGDGPFKLYRGVSGRSDCRRELGYSWSSNIKAACWFATRYQLERPTILTVTVDAKQVLFYTDDRNEAEFVIHPPRWADQVHQPFKDIADQAESYQAEIARSNKQAIADMNIGDSKTS